MSVYSFFPLAPCHTQRPANGAVPFHFFMIRNATTPLLVARRCAKSPSALISLSARHYYDDLPLTSVYTPRSQFKPKEGPPKPRSPPTPGGKPKFKPRYIPNAKNTSSDGPRLVTPYELSLRIKAMSAAGKLDEAILKLKSMPLDSQNVLVWNTILSQAMKARRYQLAYELYTDMKRRGFPPNNRTYASMLTGLSKIEDWETHPKQLVNAHALFQAYQELMEEVKARNDPQDPLLDVQPCNIYLTILGRANLYDKLFEVYYGMDESGPLQPDAFTYSSMFNALFDRKSETANGETMSQNASDARLLWRRLLKDVEKGHIKIDSHLLGGALRLFIRGRATDQLLAFDMISEYLGLAKPGDTPTPPKLPLNNHLMQIVFEGCNYTKKYRLCVHWAQQVMDRSLKRDAPPTILSTTNMEQVFHAYAAMAALGSLNESDQALEALHWMIKQSVVDAPHLRPEINTFGLVLLTCWRCRDWVSASRVFEILSGLSAQSFRDRESSPSSSTSSSSSHNQQQEKSKLLFNKRMTPDNKIVSSLVRTAMATKDKANMRQCLRMIDHFGCKKIFGVGDEILADEAPSKHSKRLAKDHLFYNYKLATGLVHIVDTVLSRKAQRAEVTVEVSKAGEEESAEGFGQVQAQEEQAPEEEEQEGSDSGTSKISKEEEQKWLEMRSQAEEIIRNAPPWTGFVPTLEEAPLGNVRGLSNIDKRSEFAWASRNAGGAHRRTY